MVNNDVKFQVLDWNSHYIDCETEDPNDKNNTISSKKYTIRLFGRTLENKTIYVQVNEYTPYFYVCVDDTWGKRSSDMFVDYLKNNIKKKAENGSWVKCLNEFVGYEIEKKHKFVEFTNFKKYTFLKLIFNDHDVMRRWARYLGKENVYRIPGIKGWTVKKTSFELFEPNIDPILRCMHIRDLEGVGWISIKGDKYERLGKSTSCCQINISTDWLSLVRINSNTLLPYVIAAFDLECQSEDGSFPQAKRNNDKIIQIGTTFSRVGESECYDQHIIVLGSCDPIEGVTVVECKTEKDLLIEWTKMIREKNPDILTGYNIFGFDYQYMKDRAHKLGIADTFEQLSRITGEKTEFKMKDLTSSALGKNILTYYNMAGRLSVDLMKIIQRDYKLISYKLDYVASYFIRENILDIRYNNKIKKTELYTKSIYGTQIGRYINIYYNDGINENKHMGDKKFQIKGFTKKELNGKMCDVILVDENVSTDILGKGYKIFWCQAKDDLEPHEIFSLQKGSSKDRAKIARYCLMDCILCNKLMNKLSIVTNNVGMANVCHVPLSYIFYRGQSVKILSLVSRKCRLKNHLILYKEKKMKTEEEKEQELKESEQFERFINKLNKKGNEEEEEDFDEEEEYEGYEGATVFPPEKGVHFEPVPVLDYSSLYPRSMILKNLSHEYYVKDEEKYGDLEGYKYHTITYVDNSIHEKVNKKNKLASMKIFTDRLKKTVNGYKKRNFVIENTKDAERNMTKIYDVDSDGNKRNLATEIIITKKSFVLSNYKTVKFAQKINGEMGIIPEILNELLEARDRTRKEMKNTEDPFQIKVLDGKQLAEKVTANSVYGQHGAPVSALYMKPIAASTTATGKEYLEFSRDFLEGHFNNLVNYSMDDSDPERYYELCKYVFGDVPDEKFYQPKNGFVNREEFTKKFKEVMNEMLVGYHLNVKSIYGDTDSVFYKPRITSNESGEVLKDKTALKWSITIGIWSSIAICLVLPEPMQQVYEKVLYPFAIITKKRYVGNLYELDPEEFYMKSMGIVLKRRDNAPIVKIVIGGIVNEILNNKSAVGAVEYTKKVLKDILSGKYDREKFIITKTLKGPGLNASERMVEEKKDKKDRYYADRTRIVHAVLADRIADRDYGNRPQSNDRIAYLYKIVKGDVELQGDRIETPEYMVENNINIDYLFYITNQIMKPAIQFLELLVHDPEKIFKEYITREENRRKGIKTIKSYCTPKNIEESGEIIDIFDIDDIPQIVKLKRKPTKRQLKPLKNQKNMIDVNDDNFMIDM